MKMYTIGIGAPIMVFKPFNDDRDPILIKISEVKKEFSIIRDVVLVDRHIRNVMTERGYHYVKVDMEYTKAMKAFLQDMRDGKWWKTSGELVQMAELLQRLDNSDVVLFDAYEAFDRKHPEFEGCWCAVDHDYYNLMR